MSKNIMSGSAKSGVHHWWMQRVTAVAFLVLIPWFLISLYVYKPTDHDTVLNWLKHPFEALMMSFLMINVLYHGALGMRVIVEDYVHNEKSKLILIMMLNLFSTFFAGMGVFSILSFYFQ